MTAFMHGGEQRDLDGSINRVNERVAADQAFDDARQFR
jgi:hypothetical protein